MKITLLALCVMLPAVCFGTPLPQYTATSSSQASAQGLGGNASASAKSQATAGGTEPCEETPPSVTPTTPTTSPSTPTTSPSTPTTSPSTPTTSPSTPTTSPSTPSTSPSTPSTTPTQPGGQTGGKASASATATASASGSIQTGKCTDVQGFENYNVVVKSQADISKFANKKWYVIQSTQVTAEVESDLCAPRHIASNCKFSEFEFVVSSETEIEYKVYGYDGSTISYVKQTLTVVSQEYLVFQSKFDTAAKAVAGSQEVTVLEQEEQVKTYFDDSQSTFGFLDTDLETYFVATTSGENSVIFICVSEELYQDNDQRQQIIQKASTVLQTNNISVSAMVELNAPDDVNVDSIDWSKASSSASAGASGSGTGSSAKVSADVTAKTGNGGSASASGKADVITGTNGTPDDSNNSPSGTPGTPGTKTGGSGCPDDENNSPSGTPDDNKNSPSGTPSGSASASGKAGAKTGNGDSSASAKSDASASSGNNGGNGQSGGKASGSASAGGSSGSNGKTGNPQNQSFSQYSVLVRSEFEQQMQQSDTTYFLWKITKSTQTIESDVTVAVDRYATENTAVKFQYTKGSQEGTLVLKEWGYDGCTLLYVQEDICFVDEEYVILKAEVTNVMKADKGSNTAVTVEQPDQIKTYLNSEYAVLGTDFETFFIGQTSCDTGSITFVAIHQEYYECEEKQQEIIQVITEILQCNGIDESQLITLSLTFDGVDTNNINKVDSKTEITSDGSGGTATKQQTTTEGKNGSKTSASTTTEVKAGGGNNDGNATPPCDDGTDATSPSGTPSTPTGVSASTNTEATAKNGGSASAHGSGSATAGKDGVKAESATDATVKGSGTASGSSDATATNTPP